MDTASIMNWIILSDRLEETPCSKELYLKVIRDYLSFIPTYKVCELLRDAEAKFSSLDFQDIIEELWKQIALIEKN